MTARLPGKRVLLTGGSGIGRAIVQRVAKDGATVALGDRNRDPAAAVTAVVELTANALALTPDDFDTHLAVSLGGLFARPNPCCLARRARSRRRLAHLVRRSAPVHLVRDTRVRGHRPGALHGRRYLRSWRAGERALAGPTTTPVVERQRVGVPASATLVASWEAATMMNRLSRPEEMAAAAVFLEGEEASYVTGSALMVEGGGAAR